MRQTSVSRIIPKDAITINLKGNTKKEVIKELVTIAKRAFKIRGSTDKIVRMVLEREKKGSTAIGSNVAIPHAQISGLKTTIGAFAKTNSEIRDYIGVDGKPVNMLFLVLSDTDRSAEYTDALRTITRIIADKDRLFSFLRQAGDPDSVHDILLEADGAVQAKS